jgi:micrococcal nuclease
MTRFHSFRAVLALAIAAGCASSASIDDAIRAEVERFVATVNRGDSDEITALYAGGDRVSSAGDGEIQLGRDAVAALMRAVFEGAESVHMSADSVVVVPLGEDAALAVVSTRWWLASAPDRPLQGAMTLVYRRVDAGWLVMHDHTSSLPGSPPLGSVDLEGAVNAQDIGPSGPVRATTPCTLTRIVDGDTIECAGVGRVRLIGMDTPERNQAPFGQLATEALERILSAAESIALEPDVEPHDRYGRTLAYVWADGALTNWRLVRTGYAVVLTYPPNVQYVEWFTAAQTAAREDGAGLWAEGGFDCLPADRRAGRC